MAGTFNGGCCPTIVSMMGQHLASWPTNYTTVGQRITYCTIRLLGMLPTILSVNYNTITIRLLGMLLTILSVNYNTINP